MYTYNLMDTRHPFILDFLEDVIIRIYANETDYPQRSIYTATSEKLAISPTCCR